MSVSRLDSTVGTPLGVIRLSASEADGISVVYQIAPVVPRMPHRMHVDLDGCVAALWRAVARRETGPTEIGCRWLSSPGESDPMSGESVDAVTWERAGIAVTIGTEDAATLAGRAAAGGLGLPQRLQSLFLAPEAIRYVADGLIVVLPPLEAGEVCEGHFVIAWGCATESLQTWFAVDQSHAELSLKVGAGTRLPPHGE